ncbi:protein dachsous-like [Glandiceps talaboti]
MKPPSSTSKRWRGSAIMWLIFCLTFLHITKAQTPTDLLYAVTEGQPPNTFVGHITDDSGIEGPFFISPETDSVLTDLLIDSMGEIRTKVMLNREMSGSYDFLAITMASEIVNVKVVVVDANDNPPRFPHPVSYIEISESSPIGSKRTIDEARDNDVGIFNTQRYEIVSGNVENAFRLDYREGRDHVLYLDLIVNNDLDRETVPRYELLIHAVDGGDPPKTGTTVINITISDTNDNQPDFDPSRYSKNIPEDAVVGTSILQVYATDKDEGSNGAVSFDINRRQSDPDEMFRIDSLTGILYLNKELNYEDNRLYELIIEAKDNGTYPEKSTAFVTVNVINVNENPPEITVLFLNGGTAEVSEKARPGEYVARITVVDPDEGELTNANVSLTGGGGFFGIEMVDNIIYLVCVAMPLDREEQEVYEMTIVAGDHGLPPLFSELALTIYVTDENDNAPYFDQSVYYASVNEVAEAGTSVFWLQGSDEDDGINAAITYQIIHVPNSFSNWFQINAVSGLITTATRIDRETKPSVSLHIMAEDGGVPPLATNVTVIVEIQDVNDNEPSFDNSFYNASVSEDVIPGYCVLQVSATDLDAGDFGRITYKIGQGFGSSPPSEFLIHGDTGWICTTMLLDRDERGSSYQFLVQAVDGGGRDSITMVRINVLDVNDNRPVFYPQTYAVDVSEGSPVGSNVVLVAATDKDSGAFGQVFYQIATGNDDGLFSINYRTGMIHLERQLNRFSASLHQFTVSAIDGGDLTSLINADVSITVIGSEDAPPIFDQPRYSFAIHEDRPRFDRITTVHAAHSDPDNNDAITYTIHSGDPNGYFYLHPNTGALTINSPLDYETHHNILLNLQASSGNPPTHGRAQVNITIIDVNDNSPEFVRINEVKSIPETMMPGTVFFVAVATDKDSGNNGKVQYRLVDDFDGMFSIDPNTGQIQLLRAVDYDTMESYQLVIEASDRGTPRRSIDLTLTVYVQDMNDNGPQFYPTSYEVSVQESLSIGDHVQQVSATDGDLGSNARITYSLKPGPYTGKFGIFPDSGIVYTRNALDREMVADFVLEVIAKDNGSPPRSATATLVIHVTDVNDNSPKMLQDSYYFNIDENKPSNSLVGSVSATDRDQGSNAEFSFTIETNNKFAIEPLTGVVTTKTVLDREEKSSYELVVTVTDHGTNPRQNTATLYITVKDENDNAPEFYHREYYVATIKEDMPANTEVIRVSAKDPDLGDSGVVTYHLVTGDELDGVSMFTVDETNGVVRTRASLDREEKDKYVLSISARDHGNPYKETVTFVHVEVEDENDNSPKFVNHTYSFTVKENTPPSRSVGHVTAYDPDIGNNGLVLYYIIEGDPDPGTFEVNRTTGEIFTIDYPDYELKKSYVLTIQATDMNILNPRRTTTTVHIYIVDLNDNAPRFEKDPIQITLRENVPVHSLVYTFTATDADSGKNGEVRYSLITPPENHTFEIDYVSGELRTIGDIDRETKGMYSLVVRATDQPETGYQMHGTTTARIFIEDVNDNSPHFASRNITYVMEDEPLEYPVVHVVALDPDYGDNGRVVYDIVEGNEDGKFSMEADTGLITLVDPLDRELRDAYALNISAADHGVPPRVSFQYLIIYVEDVNDNAPEFVDDGYLMQVMENMGSDVFVGQVNATDADIGTNGLITYSIPIGIADDMFRINGESGQIFTTETLDRENVSSYILTVYASDAAFPALYDTTTCQVTVLDANDHAPVFATEGYSISVPENGEPTELHVVAASDADTGTNAEITYSITDGNVGNKFTVHADTGVLATQLTLDRELVDHYELEITAQDKAVNPLSGSMTVTVTVVDLNDNAPEFQDEPYDVTIPENFGTNQTVLTVSALDPDMGTNANVLYTLEGLFVNMFSIQNVNGQIVSVREFDRETTPEYIFAVNATDGSVTNPMSSAAQICVTISDINDNAPVFTSIPFTINITSDIAVGSEILQLTAVDRDEGSNAEIVYSMISNSEYYDVTDDGLVKVIKQLENTDSIYRLDVKATDQGTPPLDSNGLVEIRVNNALPDLKFHQELYEETIPEHSPVGTFIINMLPEIEDYKSGTVFEITHGNEDGTFSIDASSGVINVANSEQLDREKVTPRQLFVSAVYSNQYGYTKLNVNLEDINDNDPVFTQDRYFTELWEGEPANTFVRQVSGTDEDIGENANLHYYITEVDPANSDHLFTIDELTGVVRTVWVLDREIHEKYKLTLEVLDRTDGQARTGTSLLKINIIDVNDNKPSFGFHNGINVKEGAEIGSLLTQVTANDADERDNKYPKYSILADSNPDNRFSIDIASGHITLAAPLDYEEEQAYTLNIKAFDGHFNATMDLQVTVEDENDNKPEFTQSSYETDIDELTPSHTSVITVNATDLDSGTNGEITYAITMDVTTVTGFYINPETGTIYTNGTVYFNHNQPTVQLLVSATDHGTPTLSSLVAVRIEVIDVNDNAPVFGKDLYMEQVSEGEPKGYVIHKVHATDADYARENKVVDYSIIDGNTDNMFEISPTDGNIAVVGNLDRETKAFYMLAVTASDRGNPPLHDNATVFITLTDINDHAPVFNATEYESIISEGVPAGTSILTVYATDADEGTNALVRYDITSGNDLDLFKIQHSNGTVTVKGRLDRDTQKAVHNLTIVAADSSLENPLHTVTTVTIYVTDENDHAPYFPVFMYLESLPEEEPIGTSIFTANAIDSDSGSFGILKYSIGEGEDKKYFEIDNDDGEVTALKKFDFETDKNEYVISIRAEDPGGKASTVTARIAITGVDEYEPIFTVSKYDFTVPANAEVGYVVGQVSASDDDKGADGIVFYYLDEDYPKFTMNETHGYLIVKETIDEETARRKRDDGSVIRNRRNSEDLYELVVIAKSSKPHSLESTCAVLTTVDYNCATCQGASPQTGSGLSGLPLALVIVFAIIAGITLLIVLIVCLMMWVRRKGRQPPAHNPPTDGRHSPNSYNHEGGLFDPVTNMSQEYIVDVQQIDGPPNGIAVNFMNGTVPRMHSPHTSMEVGRTDASDQSNSASSGRGSATVEDDEICRINESVIAGQNNNQPLRRVQDSGIQQDDDDTISDMSVNEQSANAVLKSIGVSPPKTTSIDKLLNQSVESMHIFGEEGGGEERGVDLGTFIETKLHEVGDEENNAIMDGTRAFGLDDDGQPSMTGSLSSIVNSDEEFSGSYNWDYLLDWGPQFQPLANVFAEIAKLKDESIAKKHIQESQSNQRHKQSLSPKVKNFPPPLLTTVAHGPVAPIQPIAISMNPGGINQASAMKMYPRVPITHDSSFSSPAMSPNFSPSLSPLANRTPSISPLVTPMGASTAQSSTGNSTASTPQRSPRSSTMITFPAMAGSEHEVTI